MSPNTNFPLPPEQQAIRAKCFHSTGKFVAFEREEIEQSLRKPASLHDLGVERLDRIVDAATGLVEVWGIHRLCA